MERSRRAEVDELTDKLIEKSEKLNYFIVTANTALLVFTFNDFNSPSGVLHDAPEWLLSVAWGSLIVASVASLSIVRQGHRLYRLHIKILNDNRASPNTEELAAITRMYRHVAAAELLMIWFFVAGVVGLVSSYLVALD